MHLLGTRADDFRWSLELATCAVCLEPSWSTGHIDSTALLEPWLQRSRQRVPPRLPSSTELDALVLLWALALFQWTLKSISLRGMFDSDGLNDLTDLMCNF